MKVRSIAIKNLSSLTLACLSFFVTPIASAIVVAGDPDQYEIAPEDEKFTGVVSLDFFGNQGCTGSLLKGGQHILTAAHCVIGAEDLGLSLGDLDVVFDLPEGQILQKLNSTYVFPDFDIDNFLGGGDIAILELQDIAPEQANQYDFYRKTNEIGKTTKIVGYGNYGTGSMGGLENSRGQKKISGKNRLDALIEDLSTALPFPIMPGSQLILDFDNRLAENDALGVIAGIHDLGFQNKEASPAFGDSGGPALIGNKIAGVTSWGIGSPFLSTDIDNFSNSSFGEISGYTRVSFYADWIDNVMAGMILPTDFGLLSSSSLQEENIMTPLSSVSSQSESGSSASVPEPTSSLSLLALGTLGAISVMKRKRNH